MFFFPPTKISPVLMVPMKKAWLSKIAVHKCLDHLKAAGRRTIPTEDTYFEQLHDKESSPEEAFLDKDFQNRVRHLCSDLKSPYREVATAHFCEEKNRRRDCKSTEQKYQNSPDADLPCKIHAEGTAGKERLDAYTTG